ncbi:MAG TPA: dihydrofolate reductase [Pyrinomonadaceae bacterium]|nr:dihydrofolate reductase [Pyrinomonadaceae bacterium]
MSIIGIVAVDRNGAIGKGGSIPWHYSADLKFFKEQTTGHACVMGRRTWASLKKPLAGRLNIVLSRSAEVEAGEGVVVLPDERSVLALAPYLACDLYVIGGEQVYKTFRQEIERWIVTEIPLSVADADTFMPADFLRGFRPTDSRLLGADALKATFYEKTAQASDE